MKMENGEATVEIEMIEMESSINADEDPTHHLNGEKHGGDEESGVHDPTKSIQSQSLLSTPPEPSRFLGKAILHSFFEYCDSCG